jgi:L-fucono-1,5-lactonase
MVIDSHVHFWKYDKASYNWIDKSMKALQQDYLPTDIKLTLNRNNVDGCIAVQSVAAAVETRLLAELANTHSFIKGVIGWADLKSAQISNSLSELRAYPALKGIRHILQSEPDEFFYNKDFRRGIGALNEHGYTFDLLIYPKQLKAAIDLAATFPDQIFILDHCGKPDIKNKEIDNWRSGINELALNPNVYCKLSGLITEAEWKQWRPADFYPYLDIVFNAFGIDRLMFGSDWPVLLLSGIYVQWKSMLEKYMEEFDDDDMQKVFGLNAERVYGL